MATVTFTIPDDYAERMWRNSGDFYLDVYGSVRDRETTLAIGRWVSSTPRSDDY